MNNSHTHLLTIYGQRLCLCHYKPQNALKTHKEQTSDLHAVLRKFKLHVSDFVDLYKARNFVCLESVSLQ